jgi:hypothetical protein
MPSTPWKRIFVAIAAAFVVLIVGLAVGLSREAAIVGYATSLFISSALLFHGDQA